MFHFCMYKAKNRNFLMYCMHVFAYIDFQRYRDTTINCKLIFLPILMCDYKRGGGRFKDKLIPKVFFKIRSLILCRYFWFFNLILICLCKLSPFPWTVILNVNAKYCIYACTVHTTICYKRSYSTFSIWLYVWNLYFLYNLIEHSGRERIFGFLLH